MVVLATWEVVAEDASGADVVVVVSATWDVVVVDVSWATVVVVSATCFVVDVSIANVVVVVSATCDVVVASSVVLSKSTRKMLKQYWL